jgi:hypothetical protein
LDKGARPKPHSILEKTIKHASLRAACGQFEADEILQAIRNQAGDAVDIEGLVGRWSDPGALGVRTLLGIRVAAADGLCKVQERLQRKSCRSTRQKNVAIAKFTGNSLPVDSQGARLSAVRLTQATPPYKEGDRVEVRMDCGRVAE